MLQENIRLLRKARGLSQEEVARRLHVTRQTLSKWENGLSVPDAQLLRRLAEVLEVPVARLLDGPEGPGEEKQDTVAQQLEQLNLLLAERNRRSRRVFRIVAGILIGAAVLTALLFVFSLAAFRGLTAEPQVSTGGAVVVDQADTGAAGAADATAGDGASSSPVNG